MDQVGVVYVFRNKINGKCYVGQTIDYERRYRDHLRSANNHQSKSAFHCALRKYGIDNFDFFIVYSCICPKEECRKQLGEQEKHFIEVFDSYNNGYNMTLGGDGVVGMSEESRKKLSKSLKGHTPWNKGLTIKDDDRLYEVGKAWRGKHHSEETKIKLRESCKTNFLGKHHLEETKRKISESHKGMIFSEDHKNHLSESHKGQIAWNKGKPMGEATKIKLSKSLKGKHPSEETRRKRSESLKGHPGWNKGKAPWNKGLTKETDERVRKYAETKSLQKKM